MAIKAEVQSMSDVIKKGLTGDKAGEFTAADGIYESVLPEDLTLDVVTRVNDHNTTFVAAATNAFGELSVEAMAKGKSIDRTSGTVAMAGKDKLSMTMDRKKVYPNPAKAGDSITKFGVVSTNYEVRAGKNSGQLKAARSTIAELAMTKLK